MLELWAFSEDDKELEAWGPGISGFQLARMLERPSSGAVGPFRTPQGAGGLGPRGPRNSCGLEGLPDWNGSEDGSARFKELKPNV